MGYYMSERHEKFIRQGKPKEMFFNESTRFDLLIPYVPYTFFTDCYQLVWNHVWYDGRYREGIFKQLFRKLLDKFPNEYWVFDFSGEPGPFWGSFNYLSECCLEFGLEMDKVIVLHSDYNMEQNYKDWRKVRSNSPYWVSDQRELIELPSQGTQDSPIKKFMYWNRAMMISAGALKNNFNKLNYVNRQPNLFYKDFLCMLRRPHKQRKFLLSLLKSEGLYDKGYVSHIWDGVTIEDNYDYLDIKDDGKNPAPFDDWDLDIAFNYYVNSRLSVVSESSIDTIRSETLQQTSFWSEKIFKPITLGHPFISVCNKGGLTFLKSLGFKVFDNIFDTSYERHGVESWGNTVSCVVNELKRIIDMNYSANDWYDLVKDDVCHNQQVLMEKHDGKDIIKQMDEFCV
jgi:hypothetical protein|tara:strand:+ start:8413 stop:9609 length:1197 start_codon:yes stop_codon:yes gene_type:complete